MQKVILIDGYGFVFRAYHSLPPFKNPQGIYVGAVFGFANMLFKVIKDHPKDKIIVVLDSGQKTFRHDIYPEYKANRPPAPEDLKPQFPIIRDAANAFNLTIVEEEGLEADDLIAALTYKAEEQNLPATIISSDKDLMQLIRGNITMYDPMKNKAIGPNEVVEKFGIRPDQICDYLSLLGDSSDNIPGVKGVGAKTALSLLTEFGSLDNIYNSIDKIVKERTQNLLVESKKNAYLSQQLIDLTKPKKINLDLDKITTTTLDKNLLGEFLAMHGFHALKVKMSAFFDVNLDSAPAPSKIIKSNQLTEITQKNIADLNKLHEAERIGVFYLKLKNSEVIIALSEQEDFYYIVKDDPEQDSLFAQTDNLLPKIQDFICDIIKNPAIRLVTSNLKQLLHFLSNNHQKTLISNINHHAHLIDLDLIEYLLPISDEQKLIKQSAEFSKIDNVDIGHIIAQILPYYQALDGYFLQLKEGNLLSVYHDCDQKINLILFNMEQKGIAVSAPALQSLSYEFAKEVNVLEKDIYHKAGVEFNIGSPKQLGEILFDKLQIEATKKTGKSGNRSTSQDILEELQSQGHDIAGLVLKWRHFTKLKSTYTDSLPKTINSGTKRIHTIFNNTLTSTGRLSSSNPNLQNIPIRTKEGDRIRSCFIAKPDTVLIAADYSQIELRLLAHMANVKLLKQAFSENKDIHRSTAAEMFEIAEDQVSSEMRRHAKQINFGIIYGISSFGLATRLNITMGRAKDFIQKYFEKYPEIKTYIHDIVELCRRDSYVETLIGRRLYFPNINIKTPALKSVIERAVINAPIQGSASDAIKKAMVNIESNLQYRNLKADLLLQVHDELIFEAPIDRQDEVLAIIRTNMENALKLSVPLTVNCGIGSNWQEIK